MATTAFSLVPPAADEADPLFRCSRRTLPATAAQAPPAGGAAAPARSPTSDLRLEESPAELPLSSRSAAGSATALLSCCLAFAAADFSLAACWAASNASAPRRTLFG
ncbi:MAG: hypothetical protein ACK559_14350, partial [bacterium]